MLISERRPQGSTPALLKIMSFCRADMRVLTTVAMCCDGATAVPGFLEILRCNILQDFAEKPKGEALKKMQVDTTALGLDAER